MALIEGPFETFSGHIQPDAELASVQKLRPQLDEVVFNLEQTELPTFPDLEVAETTAPRRRRDLEADGVQSYQRKVTLTDGTKFSDITSLVDGADGPLIVGTPAWWTSINGGLNRYTAGRLRELDRNTYLKGIAENRALSLYRHAWDVHLALDSAQLEYDIDTTTVDLQGDSNGAMTSTGTMAYGPTFARRINDAFLVDPCMAKTIGLDDVGKFMRHPGYPLKEAFCLGKQALRIVKQGEVSLGDLAGTIETSPEYLIGNLLLSRGLFWGELGHLAAHVPEDQKAHYYFFDHSIANQKRLLMRILRGSLGEARPEVTWEVRTGTHLSIANPHTIDAKVAYFAE